MWMRNFPRVEPMYAVKSNYDCNVLKLFKHIGIGFDCSSKNEIKRLIKLNVPGERILYANPIKQTSDIEYACRVGVRGLVFDNEYELVKIKTYHPRAECLLRIKVDSLPAKFGADQQKAMWLIKLAVELKINLVGVSFYVGFRQKTHVNISESIKNARALFDYALRECNYVMRVLDIGGGFPGTWQSVACFERMAVEVNRTLDEFFPAEFFARLCADSENNENKHAFKIVSELGTFYTTTSYTLCVNVVAKRQIDVSEAEAAHIASAHQRKIIITGDKDHHSLVESQQAELEKQCTCDLSKRFIYFVNDSVHASFKWFNLAESLPIFYPANDVSVRRFRRNSTSWDDERLLTTVPFYFSHVGGATCDSSDFLFKDCFMPELSIGDFLVFRNTGSYNKTGALAFNDIKLPSTVFVSRKMYSFMCVALSLCTSGNGERGDCEDNEDSGDEVSKSSELKPQNVINRMIHKRIHP
jgi:ornithine decarboxylase